MESRGRGRGWVAGLLLAGVLAGLPAWGQVGGEGGWRLSLEANTDFPLSVGGRLAAEIPGRLRLSTSLGYLPPLYLRSINALAEEVGAYDENISTLIDRWLSRSLVWRTHLGWRPFAGAGFYVEGGYGLVVLGGGVSAEEVLLSLTGISPPVGETVLERSYDVRTTLHMASVELGWQWQLAERWLVRTGVGGVFTLGSNTRVDPQFEPAVPAVTNLFTRLAEDYLDDTYRSYVHLPLVSFSLGYRF